MKKLMKVTATLMMVTMLTGSIAGCSNGTSDAGANGTEASSTEASSTEADSTAVEKSETKEITAETSGDEDFDISGLEGKRVAFISASNQYDFFVYMGAKIKQICKENGITVDTFDAKADVTKETDLMSQVVLQQYDAIIMGPVDTQALITSVEDANAAGIPVINYDSFMEADVYARIGSSNSELGKQAGEYAVEYLTEKNGEAKGNIVILSFPALETMNSRISGFKEALADYPDITFSDETVKQCDAENGQLMTENLLTANQEGKLDIVFGANAGVAIGANAAVSSAGRTDVGVIGIDDEQGELDAIADGETFLATVAQDGITIGEESIIAACKAMKGEKTGDIIVPGVLITKETVKEYLENDSVRKAELSEFK